MRVELLRWEGCPSWPAALEELRRVLSEEGADPASIRVLDIESDEQAERERFPGSPTIRIDGRDVVEARSGEPIGLSCRVYRTPDGRPSPTPDPEDVRRGVRAALG